MPRETAKKKVPVAVMRDMPEVVTRTSWEYNGKTHKHENVVHRTPLINALHNWERWIDDVVTNTLEMQDISMSDIRTLQHLRSQLSSAAENLR